MKKIKRLVFWVMFLLPNVYFGVVFAILMDNIPLLLEIPKYALILVIICVFIFTFIINIFIHELGHMVLGLMTGYKFVSFRIFSHVIFRDKDGKLRTNKSKTIGILGQCLMTYPGEYNEKIPYFWYNFGGCLFNIITASIASLLMFVFKESLTLSIVFLCMMMVCLLLGLSNLLPIVGINDGNNLLAIRNSKECHKAFYDQLSVVEKLTNGVDIKDIKMLNYEYNSLACLSISSYIMKAYNYLANEQIEEARFIYKYLEENLYKITKEFKLSVSVEIALFRALYDRDYPCVKHLFGNLKKNEIKLLKVVQEESIAMGSVIKYFYVDNDIASAKKRMIDEEKNIEKSYMIGLRSIYYSHLEMIRKDIELKENPEVPEIV